MLIVIGVLIIYLYRNKMAKSNHEITVRYFIASFAILLEVSFQVWQAFHGEWNFAESLPLHLCRLTNYLGIITMFTKSHKIFEIAYFWSLGGVVSILFPDIFHGTDRYRYYHFMMSHILFFYMYMFFVLKMKLDFKSFKKSFITLFALVMLVIVPVNNLFGMNYMYLLYPADTLFSIFEGHGYFIYLVSCFSLTTVIMVLWYLPIYFYNRCITAAL